MIHVGIFIISFLQLFAMGFATAASGPAKAMMGTLNGQVLDADSQPMPGGLISLFNVQTGPPPVFSGMNRVPDMVSRIGSAGKISLRIISGSYYMGVLKVTDPKRGPGPPRPGEKVFFASDGVGKLRIFLVTAQQVVEAGDIRTAEPEKFKGTDSLFTVTGSIVDEKGAPYPKAVILVKSNLNNQRPDFISRNIDENGHFQLHLPIGSSYYLMARQSSFGRPSPGDYIGVHGRNRAADKEKSNDIGPPSGVNAFSGALSGRKISIQEGNVPTGIASYGDIDPQSVSGKAGDLVENIMIIMTKVPDPESQRTAIQKKREEGKVKDSRSSQTEMLEKKE